MARESLDRVFKPIGKDAILLHTQEVAGSNPASRIPSHLGSLGEFFLKTDFRRVKKNVKRPFSVLLTNQRKVIRARIGR
jgi:hypothetical protein